VPIDVLDNRGACVLKWFVSRVVDLLIVFVLATILLWLGATRYPTFFPQSFYHYWGALIPAQVQR
jgi:hypothetical protein